MGLPAHIVFGEPAIAITINRVRADALYMFRPVPLDRWMPPFGVIKGTLAPGLIVRVVDRPGCPPASTIRPRVHRRPGDRGISRSGPLQFTSFDQGE
jgi:hypothetical protein